MDAGDDEAGGDGYRFSFPVGVPLVVYPVLAFVAFGNRWFAPWFALAAVLVAALFTWEAFSRGEFEKIRGKDPSMNLATWRFNWLAFFALPGYGVGIVSAWMRG